ncbi:MFS transporter [Candidatus Acetothermia bacterium]|nr:MFS transporter [Candidatus Acetothermia bacterium]MBI3643373.1 MFS transporter [Candidatus Acetothermia bacterium]
MNPDYSHSKSEASGGIPGYFEKIRLFSYNARLYLLHVIGMDLIHGTWEVIFNLYLLELGFSIEFIGLRIAITGIAGATASIPMGWLSDRIGRKAGFILGDGGGALMSLIQILSINPAVLLVSPAIGALFGALHNVTEPAFMAENSQKEERVHLFSVSDGLRTLSAMLGSLAAGFLPLWIAIQFDIDKVVAYRYATFIGIAWWFLSLIPALLLRQQVAEKIRTTHAVDNHKSIWKRAFPNLKNPKLIGKFLLVNALISLGAGFVVPLFNVFFHEGVHADENEIGMLFAAGSLFLAFGAFAMPFFVGRFGKVKTVTITRLAAVPFVVLIGFAPSLADTSNVLSIAGLAYILRTTFFNMSYPVADAFTMELLDPRERATATGLQATAGRIAMAGAGFLGALLMSAGNYQTRFFLMAFFYLMSTLIFWRIFRSWEDRKLTEPQAQI